MTWTEIRIHSSNDAVEPISNILHEFGVNGVVIENPQDLTIDHDTAFGEIFELDPLDYPETGVYIKAYLPTNSFLTEKMDEIKQQIKKLEEYDIDLGPNQIMLTEVKEEDWATVWKKYYHPMKISDFITIAPIWENYERKSEGEVVIELDPGMAFGTGTHPTTVLCLRSLEKYLRKEDIVIDVGCGSGVLSIASIQLGAKEVYSYDLDEIAVESTNQNAKINHVEKKIHVRQNNLLDNVEMDADLIVSNILAEIIVRFVGDAWENLKHDGLFITSGIIQTKKQMVIDSLEKQGFSILEVDELEDWVSIVAQKK